MSTFLYTVAICFIAALFAVFMARMTATTFGYSEKHIENSSILSGLLAVLVALNALHVITTPWVRVYGEMFYRTPVFTYQELYWAMIGQSVLAGLFYPAIAAVCELFRACVRMIDRIFKKKV